MGYKTGITEIPELVMEKLAANFASDPPWLPKIVEDSVHRLGEIAVNRMRQAVNPNFYMGDLSNSITVQYGTAEGDAHNISATIGPTALRGGRYDAGVLLELGTKPIPNAPYKPIAMWAAFKGAPMPGAWLAIRKKGVQAHPFLDRTVELMEPELDAEQESILDAMIEHVLEGTEPA